MITAGRDLYDDPRFFEGYRRLRNCGGGINDAIEIPAMSRMITPVAGAAVIDLGCGAGALAHRLADAGAAHVLAVDSSQRMLALATPHPRVRHLHADLDELTLPARCADLVVSSLVLHYVADYPGLVRRVAHWLRPGGRFVFSIEHPICTAADPMTGWRKTGESTVWPVSTNPFPAPPLSRAILTWPNISDARRCWCWGPAAGTSISPTKRSDECHERQPVRDDRLRLLPPPAP